MLDTPTQAPPRNRGNIITKATARDMVAKSNASQKRRRAFLKSTVTALLGPRHQNLDPTAIDFNVKRLARLRAQLDLLDGAIEREAIKHSPDGQKLDRLASAQARLSAEERKLAGRPEPGKEGKRSARRDRPAGESMLDLGHVSPPVAAAPPSEARPLGWEYDEPATEVPPATVPPSAPSSTVCSTCPPSTPDRLPGDVTP